MKSQRQSVLLLPVLLLLVLAVALVANPASAMPPHEVRAPQVPCLQSKWDKTTGACYILNECDITMYGFAMCDHDVSMCGSSRVDGVAMCGHSSFFLGYCKDYCQGLTWNQINSTSCLVNGKCCSPRTAC